MSIRTERVSAEIQKALSAVFQRSLPDYLDGMVTVTSVKMSPDLGIARVYVSFFRSTTSPEMLVKRLNTHSRELRHELGRSVRLRVLPELRFFRDDTLDAVDQIQTLLRNAKAEDEELRRLRGETTNNEGEDGAES